MSMSRRCLASAWRRAAAAACTTGRSDVARAALQDVRNAAGTSGGTARWSQVTGGQFVRGFAASGEGGAKSTTDGPVSWVSLVIALATGTGLVTFYQYERNRLKEEAVARGGDRSVGSMALGGPFRLINHLGKETTEKDLLGKFALLYFGFTHCPDICPEELVKICEAVDIVEKKTKEQVTPVFVSIDPERDSVQQVKEYVQEFHPRLVGLTGSVEACAAAARQFRVYYHKTGDEDYLVDHSIISYLLDSEGKFVAYYGKNVERDALAAAIEGHINNYRSSHGGKK